MTKVIGLILTIFVIISCSNSNKPKIDDHSEFMIEFEQIEFIAQRILDLPELQWVYHPEVNKRLPIKVLESEMIDKKLNLNKFGQKVRILSFAELEKEGIKDYLIFDKFQVGTDTAEFRLKYRIEGVDCSGTFLRQNGEWKVLNYSVLEN